MWFHRSAIAIAWSVDAAKDIRWPGPPPGPGLGGHPPVAAQVSGSVTQQDPAVVARRQPERVDAVGHEELGVDTAAQELPVPGYRELDHIGERRRVIQVPDGNYDTGI